MKNISPRLYIAYLCCFMGGFLAAPPSHFDAIWFFIAGAALLIRELYET